MTDEQIDALTAGPEIDELAARLVMKFTEQQINAHRFRPSTNIADTKCVWDELIRREWEVNTNHEHEWIVWMSDTKTRCLGARATAPTLELAMTKAALKAVGKET